MTSNRATPPVSGEPARKTWSKPELRRLGPLPDLLAVPQPPIAAAIRRLLANRSALHLSKQNSSSDIDGYEAGRRIEDMTGQAVADGRQAPVTFR